MHSILSTIIAAAASNEKLLTVLIDPDKFEEDKAADVLERLPLEVAFLFVGGSTVDLQKTDLTVKAIKRICDLPIILFPGDVSQISLLADGILFLSLISGRNPEYLIGQQVRSIPVLLDGELEILPTGYILLDGGKESAVERVSGTEPLSQEDVDLIKNTALAGEYSGKKMIYLEAGSGARVAVNPNVIAEVKKVLSVPLIVGGGIRSREQLTEAFSAGADVVVVGTAFEENSFVENGTGSAT